MPFLDFFGGIVLVVFGIDPGYAIVGWGAINFQSNTYKTLGFGAIETVAGTDGVQSHTCTLWKLLKKYNVPCFIFITACFEKIVIPRSRSSEKVSRNESLWSTRPSLVMLPEEYISASESVVFPEST